MERTAIQAQSSPEISSRKRKPITGACVLPAMALEDTRNGDAEKMDGFTPEQRFFLA
jgi:hypothetical protein